MTEEGNTERSAEALAERIFAAALGTFDLAGIYLGDRLGLYAALVEHGPATVEALATRAGTDERYTREWLEQQAVTGILDVDLDRRFSLPPAYRAVLVEPESLSLMAPVARMVAAAAGRLPDLVRAYRTGDGMPWSAYGDDMREGQGSFNRPAMTHLLGAEWLPAVPGLEDRLRSEPPARVVDIGCGEGWSTLAVARAYPTARVVGIDLDAPSIEAARRHAAEAGLDGAVEFRVGDAAALDGPFDLAIIIEAVHDLSDPVPVLAAIRNGLADGGSLLVVDERVAESFTAPGDDVERFMYGWSITTCLPDGRSRQPSVATGTVMRPDTLRGYASDAGFTTVEVLPIENDFFRFYRLTA